MEDPVAERIESFDLAEQQLAIQPWDVRFEQPRRGRFHCRLQSVKTPGMRIHVGYFERVLTIEERGHPIGGLA